LPIFAEKEGKWCFCRNGDARRKLGRPQRIGGLQTSREPQFAQQSNDGRKHPCEFKLQYTLGFDRKGSRNLTLWDSHTILCQILRAPSNKWDNKLCAYYDGRKVLVKTRQRHPQDHKSSGK
jgi:hypothetical protein